MIETTWTLVADSSRARVFETRQSREDFREIESMANPAARARERDIQTDRLGHSRGSAGSSGGSGDPQTTPIQHEIEQFSKAVCRFIDAAREQGRFDRLRIVAFPKFLGLLRKDLGDQAHQAVSDEIPKDISALNPKDIQNYVARYGRALG